MHKSLNKTDCEGKKQGYWEEQAFPGRRRLTNAYKRGMYFEDQREGHWELYMTPENELLSTRKYANGEPVGPSKFYMKGKLYLEIEYFKNSFIETNYDTDNGSVISKEFYIK